MENIDLFTIIQSLIDIQRLSQKMTEQRLLKLPAVIRNKYRVNEQHRLQEAVQIKNHVIQQITTDHGGSAAELYQEILSNMALSHDGNIINPPKTKSLQEQLQPLCELAYYYEQNGVASTHAQKLGLIFTDFNRVLAYLSDFALNKPGYLLHDACLFDVPLEDDCDFKTWKIIANKKLSPPNVMAMQLPFFRKKILPLAKNIEQMAIADTPNNTPDWNAIKSLEKEIAALSKQYKKVKRHKVSTPEEKLTRTENMSVISQQLDSTYEKLAKIGQGVPIDKMSLYLFKSFYKSYQEKLSPETKLLTQHGIGDSFIEQFLALPRKNNDERVPSIFIKGSDIECNGFYLRKLNTTDKKDAALAAILGKLTGCCQYIGGIGSPCVVHSISSESGAAYVLFQGDENNPQFGDRVAAQGWVWSTGNGLVIDSVELALGKDASLAINMFRYAAHQICTVDNVFDTVKIGANSGISNAVGVLGYPVVKSYLHGYKGYCDSSTQRYLANKDMPYLFYNDDSSSAFQNIVASQTKNHLEQFRHVQPLHQCPHRIDEVKMQC